MEKTAKDKIIEIWNKTKGELSPKNRTVVSSYLVVLLEELERGEEC